MCATVGSGNFGPVWLENLAPAFEITLNTLMCLFTSIQFIKEYRMRKRVPFNHYMISLVKDGMIYFIVYVWQGSIFLY